MNGTPNDIVHKAMIEQACAWQARCLSGEMTAAEKIEFLKWLQDNPRNVREYLQTAQMAKLFPRALAGLDPTAAVPDDDSSNILRLPVEQPAEAPAGGNRRPVAQSAGFKIAAGLLFVCAALFASHRFWNASAEKSYVVPHGDQRIVRLSDGSLIHLNSNSSARVRYLDSERRVELDKGQAMFDVAADPKRPFRVHAGRTEVVAIGTQFDVYRRDIDHVTVTVVEGRVEVVDQRAPSERATAAPRLDATRPTRLDVGQQVQAGNGQPVISKIDVNTATAWVRRQIVFNGRPLSEVADEFNRYLSVPVYIDDATLRNTRVSGTFSAYDEAAFVAFLREFDEAQVEVGDKEIHVRSRAAQ